MVGLGVGGLVMLFSFLKQLVRQFDFLANIKIHPARLCCGSIGHLEISSLILIRLSRSLTKAHEDAMNYKILT